MFTIKWYVANPKEKDGYLINNWKKCGTWYTEEYPKYDYMFFKTKGLAQKYINDTFEIVEK